MSLQGPEEWNRFLGGLLTHVNNLMEKTHEESARLTIANLIGGVTLTDTALSGANKSVVHLITEYNAYSGQSLTPTTVFNPANYPAFARWFFGRLKTASQQMAERSQLFHTNLTAGTFQRQSAVEDQRLIMLAPMVNQLDTEVLSTTYNAEYLRTIPREEIAYWQNIADPMTINTTASYLKADGTIGTGSASISDCVAVLFDRDAAGYTMIDARYEVAPYNVAGQYYNHWWSFEDRYYNDFTENCIVFTLD